MRIAAHDLGRLSRLIAGCAGVIVAVLGVLTPLTSSSGGPPGGVLSDPAAALVPAGLALLLRVLPVSHRIAGRVVRVLALLSALAAAALGAAALDHRPATAVATLLGGSALACLDIRVARRSPDAFVFRISDPLLAGTTAIALVALVPRDLEPGATMTPYAAGGLLALTVGTVLARPEAGPPRTTRRALPVLVAVPAIAALVGALAGPAAAAGIGVVLAALALFGLIGYLVRTLHDAGAPAVAPDGREEFADSLLQSMNEAVMVLDANHRVIDVNRRWRELTGHGPDEPIRFDPPPLPPPEGGDWLMPRVDGTEVPVLATVAAVPDAGGAPRAYVATYVDIAERKRAEESLSQHAAELERGNARLEAALAFKNDLTSMLTHDMAQPISSIASLAELLREDWADLPEDVRLELATKIDKNTRRLIKMMNDLQLLFRLDTGSVTARRTPVSLLEVVGQATADGPGEVDVAIDAELAALADRGHLIAVLRNLLTNAFTYGDPPVRVRGERRDDLVEITVQDSGPGIPDELLPHLFDRFMRGAGLGLFIVRHLVEANGGTVRYERADPRGARLVVHLEAAPV